MPPVDGSPVRSRLARRLLRLAARNWWLALVVSAGCGGGTPTQPTPVHAEREIPRLQFTNFLAFGDSLTEGKISATFNIFTLGVTDAYPFKLRSQLTGWYLAQVIRVDNDGMAGEEAAGGGIDRFAGDLARYHPEVVLVMEGTNDLFQDEVGGIPRALSALETMLKQAAAQNVKPFLATIPPQRRGGPRERVARVIPDFNQQVRALAARLRVPLVDVYAAMAGDPSLIGADDLHPTEAGYDVMTKAFFDAIREELDFSATTH